MKQVWILNHYAREPAGTGSTRHFHLIKNMHSHGWAGTIIASSVEHRSGRQRLRHGERFRLEWHDDVPFLWLRGKPYNPTGISRVWNMLSYSCGVLMPWNTRCLARPDVVIGSSVHPLAALSGAILARRFGVPFVFEVRDLWPLTLIDLGVIRENGLVARSLRRLELFLYRRADRIVVLLPHANRYIAPLGVDETKVVWLSNGFSMDEFPEPLKPESDGRELRLMYFGAHGKANALEPVISAMAIVKERLGEGAVSLRLIGDGPLKPRLRRMVSAAGLDGLVHFENSISKKAIPATAREADAFVISVADAPRLYRFGISMNKLFEYMAAGRPILIASGAINNPVNDAGCGITTPPGDPSAIAEGIERLARMRVEERHMLGMRGRRYAEANFSYRSLGAKLAALLDDCLRNSTA